MSQPLNETQVAAIAREERIDPELVRTIGDAAVRHDVDPMLLLAIGKQETDFGRSRSYDGATGLGDGGNGHGMFQLDGRTPGRDALLRSVDHDDARSADVAAGMVREGLDRSHGDVLGAMRYYNSGKIHGRTSTADFHGHHVPYETAVASREDEYRTAAGAHHAASHPTAKSEGVAPRDQWNSAQFVRNEHLLRVVDAQGHVREFAAFNNTTHQTGDPNTVGSHGPAPDGTYPLRPVESSYADGERGKFGPVGAAHIGGNVPELRGLLIHSGRGNDPSHVTWGCIRTTDEAMRYLRDHSVSRLTIEEGRAPEQTPVTHQWETGDRSRENNAELHARTEQRAHAIADAREGQIDDVRVARIGNEGIRSVAARDEELHRAILAALPPSMRERYERQTGIERGPELVGEVREGRRHETNAELEAKNALVQRAVARADHGFVEQREFHGTGRESAAQVAFQNDTLRREILQHLPTGERERYRAELVERNALPLHPAAVPAPGNFRQSGTVLDVDRDHGVFVIGGGRAAEWAIPIAAVDAMPHAGDRVTVQLRDGSGDLTVEHSEARPPSGWSR
ncbi:MAG: hypothetical protein IAI50_03160 [Candidatus Eremiobacteraeota bacterium]|nr:hypothetical protein [Candidatus Eremiobacteraeota bacterium]